MRPAVKAVLLLGSGMLLFTGLFIAVTAQIGVMGTSQAPQIAGSVERSGNDVVVRASVQASGVRSVDRITIYSYQTNDDAESANMPQLYQSSSGPDANGVVNVPLQLVVHNGPDWPQLVVITAVLGEDKRNCDGRPVQANSVTSTCRRSRASSCGCPDAPAPRPAVVTGPVPHVRGAGLVPLSVLCRRPGSSASRTTRRGAVTGRASHRCRRSA